MTGDARLRRIHIVNDLQMTPLSLPGLRIGENTLNYTDRTKGARKVRITHEWVERSVSRPPLAVPAEIARPSSPYPVDQTLVLGAVDDEDWTYLNGKFIGSMTKITNPNDYYQVTRKYIVPKGLLKVGRNVLAVQANDIRQAGGIKGSVLERRGGGAKRWLSGLYLDKPEALDDPYRYLRW